jgi:hypothetical protein
MVTLGFGAKGLVLSHTRDRRLSDKRLGRRKDTVFDEYRFNPGRHEGPPVLAFEPAI